MYSVCVQISQLSTWQRWGASMLDESLPQPTLEEACVDLARADALFRERPRAPNEQRPVGPNKHASLGHARCLHTRGNALPDAQLLRDALALLDEARKLPVRTYQVPTSHTTYRNILVH